MAPQPQDGGGSLPPVSLRSAEAVGIVSGAVSVASDGASTSTGFGGPPTGFEQQVPVTTFTPRRADLHMGVRLVVSGSHPMSRFTRGPGSAASGGQHRESGGAVACGTGASSAALCSGCGSEPSALPEAGGALPADGAAAADANEVELLVGKVLGKGAFGQVRWAAAGGRYSAGRACRSHVVWGARHALARKGPS
jgi:hypothetical protein